MATMCCIYTTYIMKILLIEPKICIREKLGPLHRAKKKTADVFRTCPEYHH